MAQCVLGQCAIGGESEANSLRPDTGDGKVKTVTEHTKCPMW